METKSIQDRLANGNVTPWLHDTAQDITDKMLERQLIQKKYNLAQYFASKLTQLILDEMIENPNWKKYEGRSERGYHPSIPNPDGEYDHIPDDFDYDPLVAEIMWKAKYDENIQLGGIVLDPTATPSLQHSIVETTYIILLEVLKKQGLETKEDMPLALKLSQEIKTSLKEKDTVKYGLEHLMTTDAIIDSLLKDNAQLSENLDEITQFAIQERITRNFPSGVENSTLQTWIQQAIPTFLKHGIRNANDWQTLSQPSGGSGTLLEFPDDMREKHHSTPPEIKIFQNTTA